MIFFLFTHVLQSLLLISDKSSTRFDNLCGIILQLSINFILYVIVLQLSFSFLIGIEKVIYFSVFSPKHSNWPLNSSAKIANAMSCSSKFSCIMTMISNFLVYFKFLFFIFIITKLFLTYVAYFLLFIKLIFTIC